MSALGLTDAEYYRAIYQTQWRMNERHGRVHAPTSADNDNSDPQVA